MVSNREDSRFIGLVRFVFDEVLRSIEDFSSIDFSKVRRPAIDFSIPMDYYLMDDCIN